jgi:hypothetical protein
MNKKVAGFVLSFLGALQKMVVCEETNHVEDNH